MIKLTSAKDIFCIFMEDILRDDLLEIHRRFRIPIESNLTYFYYERGYLID
jgi:hypothetical protein